MKIVMTTETMEQRAIRALSRTWDVIGYDSLQAAVDCGEAKNVDDVVMTRAEVIDCVASCGFMGGYPESYGGDKEAVEWLESQPEKVQNEILKKAFPHARYGT